MTRYRLVTDRTAGFGYVITRQTGHQGRVTLAAAEILAAAIKTPIDVLEVNSAHAKFIGQARRLGWIDQRGSFEATQTEVTAQPHLKRIQIELTLKCNLKCSYCYSSSGPNRRESLPLTSVFALLDDAFDLGCLSIDFTGGEFFLYPHWKAVLQRTHELGLPFTIHCNGTALTESNVEIADRYGVRQIQVSIDSHLAQIHDDVRGQPGALAKAKAGIAYARSHNIPVNASVVLHKKNRDQARELVNFINRDLGAKAVIDRVIPAGRETEAELGLTPAEFFEAVSPLLTRDVRTSMVCNSSPIASNSILVEPACGVAHSFAYITAQGEIALCPTMTSRDEKRFSGPNIREMSLKEAWTHSPYFNSYRYLNCRNVGVCPASKQCGGGCRSNAYLDTGDVQAPDVVSCNLFKNPDQKFVDFRQLYDAGIFTVEQASA